ncbi:hypothetical protein A8139_20990 [Marinomonas primoryensis]|uniref:TnsA endonuclease N-terminal domain-containing protein n=1 Tax=Marinomonas primoryensis TaxID=178399 RepID=A0A2Z4PXG5_9GAMM|nr:TnsA endonuclease C-terminal domain-containing protein [Marinomonas primoryensis]AWY02137.1 hypothetical protein A8139_20990 [Marinomonas primoryensis]
MVATYNLFSEKQISKKFKNGCGRGAKASYHPWLTIREFTSSGRSHRSLCNTSGRLLHLFSDLEFMYSCLLDWNEKTSDIRERFPLVTEDVCQISEEANLPILICNSVPQVRFSDFLIDDASHANRQYAIDVRYSQELATPAALESIELQRRYWHSKNIGFFVATERNMPKTVLNNLKWLLPVEEQVSLDSEYLMNQYEFFRIQMSRFYNIQVIDFTKHIDTQYSMKLGESLFVLRCLLASRFISFDIKKPFNILLCKDLVFTRSDEEVWGILNVAN